MAGVDEEVGRVPRYDVALQLVCQPAVVEVVVRQGPHLADHFANQLAAVTHLEFGQLLGLARDDLAESPQQLATRGRSERAPRSIQCSAGGGYGAVHISGPAVGDACPGPASEGVNTGVGP